MNWEAVGAIAELLAAIGVIGSLIYLAKQINANSENVAQNTRVLISDRDIDSNQNAKDLGSAIYKDAELAALVLKGHRKEVLDEIERLRYNTFLSTMFETHQTFFIQHLKGTVSNELWDFYSGAYDQYMLAPGVQQWWQRNRSRFNREFAAYIEEKVQDEA